MGAVVCWYIGLKPRCTPWDISDLGNLEKVWKAVFAWDWSSLCVARVVAICYGSNCQSWHVTGDSSVTPIIYLRFNRTSPPAFSLEGACYCNLQFRFFGRGDEPRKTMWVSVKIPQSTTTDNLSRTFWPSLMKNLIFLSMSGPVPVLQY